MKYPKFAIAAIVIPTLLFAGEKYVTESEFSGNDEVDEVSNDSLPPGVNEDTEDSPELSAEDADADMAMVGDTLIGDSAVPEFPQTLTLNMKNATVPSASRRISSPYGIRTYRMHRGVDLGLCNGEDRTIVAPFSGVVVKVRNQGRRKGYGKYVILDHGNGLTTTYAHLAKWTVNVGDSLQVGDTLGIGGNTGRSFGAHLHFEMKYNGLYIDPTLVFNFAEGTFVNATANLEVTSLQATEDEYQKELAKHRYYKVRRGDCLGKIARKYGISVHRLKQLNNMKSDRIRPGQVLRCS
ncbi:MAG: peptidoglycan DD-metalloendopeptidase family protein [Fibrobacteraceae bacterium]|nr:peptidoglycan DD-metalloendopeptidase family protein [Fibrobacteraceae bacterium]